MTITV